MITEIHFLIKDKRGERNKNRFYLNLFSVGIHNIFNDLFMGISFSFMNIQGRESEKMHFNDGILVVIFDWHIKIIRWKGKSVGEKLMISTVCK